MLEGVFLEKRREQAEIQGVVVDDEDVFARGRLGRGRGWGRGWRQGR